MVMRTLTAGILAAALAGCAPSVSDTALAGLNLADGATLAALQAALPQDDRAALGTYALLHWPKSRFYCGKPVGGRSPEAATVGEAIALTRTYERELELARRAVVVTPGMARQTKERALITRIDHLVLERDMLFARNGAPIADSPRAAQIAQQLDGLRAELDDLRQTSPG